MKRVALVVQRFGGEVQGGAETYAGVLARVLKAPCEVTILTSTARDHITWARYYREGESVEDGLSVLRFHPDFETPPYFHELNRIFLGGINPERFFELSPLQKRSWQERCLRLPVSFQEELIRWQGPFSSGLFQYLRDNWPLYDAVIFFTYLYPTTYFGVDCVGDPGRVFLHPTLHDEAHAYLSIWRKYSRYNLLFSTQEEADLARRLWGEVKGRVVGYGLVDQNAGSEGSTLCHKTKHGSEKHYLLYAGRIDAAKGVNILLDYFSRYKLEHPESLLKLKLIGRASLNLQVEKSAGIELCGFVSEEEKLRLMAGALAVVLPSPYESLSIVVLEAFMMGTPVVVNGYCPVLAGHVNRSGAGFAYRNYREFVDAVETLRGNLVLRNEVGKKGRAYFLENYEWSRYKARLLEALNLV
ncbi:glycosyltransferase family 4 protein [Desulfofundulus thermosubterraneus]|uniref:Glycosyltransferase involved in cell wall bisynthesis n=1 Tax=Desulfofundulus thermosubterraneus DSM 16057 TaxID=1121432 RepID=A0A1M6FT16_9FIRM|nr:glycosyltransferase family 4 protein [Desulfofundulus thermosubterraneus]SHJ00858.1 Glycosyltransferase involved in cell wall bisynthesis [Desulfofundulus thermosubterraneus DSM 16057]